MTTDAFCALQCMQDTMVSDIMRPRVEVVALEASTDIATFVGAVSGTGETFECSTISCFSMLV